MEKGKNVGGRLVTSYVVTANSKHFLGGVQAENLTQADVVVTFDDFRTAIANVKPSVSVQDLLYFEQLKKELSSA